MVKASDFETGGPLSFLCDGGAVGALMREHDWRSSPLGPPTSWPQSLRSVVGLVLGSKFPMFVAWGPELGFVYNDAYAEILRDKHPAALGARFHDIWSEIWADISPLIDAAMSGEATYREDLPLLMNRKGYDEETWFTFSYSPVRDESGQVAGLFCAVAEMTRRVLAETALQAINATLELRVSEALAEQKLEQQRLAKAEEQLRNTQKIEAIGQLTGGVAHDFNNLLMVILGGLSVLDRQEDPARRQRILDGMRQAAERGAGLSRQLLAFSRRQALQAEPVDLRTHINGMSEFLGRALSGDVVVRTDLPGDLWPVMVDPGELELVILNLCVNARDAMQQGGVITIGCRNVVEAGERGPVGDFVRLDVQDSGSGMSPEVLSHAFEPFFTTKPIGKGSGLGLAQVHGFASQSGGAAFVESRLGEGTTVSLLLPRTFATPRSAIPGGRDIAVDGPAGEDGGHVLLVEDDDEVAAFVSEMLQRLGFEITRVSGGLAALGALANARAIDLLFSDVMMPGDMNGMDLVREARRRRPDLPVLLTSGYAGAALREAAEAGVEVLRKPYDLETLNRTLRQALSQTGPAKRVTT